MTLRIIDALSQPGHTARANEDAFGHTSAAVWVIDGATGLSPHSLTGTASDAAWFAQRISHHLTHVLAQPASLVEAAAAAMTHTSAELISLCEKLPDNMVDMPCASGLIVQQRHNHIDVAFYGDCHLLAQLPNGEILHMGGDPVHEKVDADNIAEMVRHRRTDEPLTAARARAIPLIAAGRKLANLPHGYPLWSPFADAESCATHATRLHQYEFSVPEGTILLLMSDGFYRLVDVLLEMDNAQLIEAAKTHGLTPLLKHLRQLEIDDAEALTYPRFKTHDDATAVLVKVN